MKPKLFPVKGNLVWLEKAFSSANKSKSDIILQLEFLADLIHSGTFTIGEKGIVAKKEKDGRIGYAVEVFGSIYFIEIVDSEPPSDDSIFVLVAAPNPLKQIRK